jgi:dihydropyrimidine dehydrogenase (NAD+) subunit PreA
MDEKEFADLDAFRGRSLPNVTDWQHLDLNFKIVARINPSTCIGCQLCYTACWDGAHQCIHLPNHARDEIASTPAMPSLSHAVPAQRIPKVDEGECVGCNLCWLVCPVENCIEMVRVDSGAAPESWAERTAR